MVRSRIRSLHQVFPDEHLFNGHPLMPSVSDVPPAWLLGSIPGGSNLAAGPGIGYTIAGFINPLGDDELVVQNLIAAPADRRRSHSLLAEAFGVQPRDAAPAEERQS